MSTLVSIENSTVKRDGQTILDNISMQINQNDFLTILGPNGAGKSMLLKLIIGFYKASKGRVFRKEGLKIGYVPQRLITDYTIPISTYRFISIRKKVSKETIYLIAEETAISHLLNKPVNVLSGGELQRVLLARALLESPELLILDEPAQNLDVSGQLSFYKLLKKIYDERKLTVLMVSHDLNMVMSCTKKVVCLYKHICCSGEPQVVTKDPEFISLFGSEMAKMVSVYHHEHDHEHGTGEKHG